MERKGFTLTEVLVVIAVLAVMVVIGVPVISSVSKQAGLEADSITAQSIETSIDVWMNSEYSDESIIRTNLFNISSRGEATTARINGYTEQMYSYFFAGMKQLPGVELTNESQVRHSVIVAVKATSEMPLDIRSDEQFIKAPKVGSQYGFKYYYKIGKVSVEKLDSTVSPFGADEIYKYYVWLDQPGGVVSADVESRKTNNGTYLSSYDVPLSSFKFNFGTRDASKVRVEIEKEGLCYSLIGKSETAQMFTQGEYNLKFYYNGELFNAIEGYVLIGNNVPINP